MKCCRRWNLYLTLGKRQHTCIRHSRVTYRQRHTVCGLDSAWVRVQPMALYAAWLPHFLFLCFPVNLHCICPIKPVKRPKNIYLKVILNKKCLPVCFLVRSNAKYFLKVLSIWFYTGRSRSFP